MSSHDCDVVIFENSVGWGGGGEERGGVEGEGRRGLDEYVD